MNKIVFLVDNVHMGKGHDGLNAMATSLGKNPETLKDNELMFFVNRTRDKVKALGAKGRVIGYLRLPANKKVTANTFYDVVAAFGGDILHYPKGLESTADATFKKRYVGGAYKVWQARSKRYNKDNYLHQ
jgi:hypothetical protein